MAYNPFYRNAYLGNGQYDQLEVLRKSKDPLINYEGLYEDAPSNIATSNIFKAMQPEFEYRNPRFLDHAERKGMVDLADNVPIDRDRRIDFARYWSDSPLYSRRSKARFEDFNPRVGQPLGYQEAPLGYQEAEADQEIDIDSLDDPFTNNIFEQDETISTPNTTVSEQLIDENRIPGKNKNKANALKNFAIDKGKMILGLPGIIASLLSNLGDGGPYEQYTPGVDYNNLNPSMINDFYNPVTGLNRFDRAKTAFGKSRTLFGPNGIAATKAKMAKAKKAAAKAAAQAYKEKQAAAAITAANNPYNPDGSRAAYNYAGRDNAQGTHTSTMSNTQAQANQDRGRGRYNQGGLASLFTRRG